MNLFKPQDHKVIVMNREDFEEYVKNCSSKVSSVKDTAFIEVYTGPRGKPILSKSPNMIALDFDDWPAEVILKKPYHTNTTITYDQAEKLVKFIRKHWGKNFIIHCDAGVSRSQQIASFILLMSMVWGTLSWAKPEVSIKELVEEERWAYTYDKDLSTHSYHHSQTPVLTRLLEVNEVIYPRISKKYFKYNPEERRWYEK